MSSTPAANPDVVITHPNRDTAEAKSTRVLLIALTAASAILVLVISLAGAGSFSGAQVLQFIIGLLFVYYTYALVNWRSGILPITAGTAVVSGIFAAVSVPGWYDRGGEGYANPPLPEPFVGALVIAFALLQLVIIVVALRAFQQQWQVELEVPRTQAAGPLPA